MTDELGCGRAFARCGAVNEDRPFYVRSASLDDCRN